MPVGRDPQVVAEAQKTYLEYVYLVEVDSAHGKEYYAVTNVPLTVQGQVWEPMEIKFQEIPRQGGKAVGRVTLVIDNTQLDYSKATLVGDYDGREVTIWTHFPEVEDSKELFFRGYIESFTIGPKEVRLTLVPVTDYMALHVPKRRYSTKCPWRYKGPRCPYTGSEASCPAGKRFEECPVVEAFGGFPFIKPS